MSEPEENFTDDQEEYEEVVTNALNELCQVKAYVLKPKELQYLKAAQDGSTPLRCAGVYRTCSAFPFSAFRKSTKYSLRSLHLPAARQGKVATLLSPLQDNAGGGQSMLPDEYDQYDIEDAFDAYQYGREIQS